MEAEKLNYEAKIETTQNVERCLAVTQAVKKEAEDNINGYR
jgi:hypothetical protein